MSQSTAKQHGNPQMSSTPLRLNKANKPDNIRKVVGLLDGCLQEQQATSTFNKVQMIPPVYLPNIWGERIIIARADEGKGGYSKEAAGDVAERDMYFALQDCLEEMAASDQITGAVVIHGLKLDKGSLLHLFIDIDLADLEIDFIVIVWTKRGHGLVYMIEVKNKITELPKALTQMKAYNTFYARISEQLGCDFSLVLGVAVQRRRDIMEPYETIQINNCGEHRDTERSDKTCPDCLKNVDDIRACVDEIAYVNLKDEREFIATIDLRSIFNKYKYKVFQFNGYRWKAIHEFLTQPLETSSVAAIHNEEVARRATLEDILNIVVSLRTFSKLKDGYEVDPRSLIKFGGKDHCLAKHLLSPQKAASFVCRKSLRLEYLKHFKKSTITHEVKELQDKSNGDDGWLKLAASELKYLTDEQYTILSNESLRRLEISGDFGTGKTLLLMIKAGTLVQSGKSVTIFAPENLIQQQYKPFFEKHLPGIWRPLVRYISPNMIDNSEGCLDYVKKSAIFMDEVHYFVDFDNRPRRKREESFGCFTTHIVNDKNSFVWSASTVSQTHLSQLVNISAPMDTIELNFSIRSPPQIYPFTAVANEEHIVNTSFHIERGFVGLRARLVFVKQPQGFVRHVVNEIHYWKQFVPNCNEILVIDYYPYSGKEFGEALKDEGIANHSSLNDSAPAPIDSVCLLPDDHHIAGLEYKVVISPMYPREGGRSSSLFPGGFVSYPASEWDSRALFGLSVMYTEYSPEAPYKPWPVENSYIKIID